MPPQPRGGGSCARVPASARLAAAIIEVSISQSAPWYSLTGRLWWLSADPCGAVSEVKALS
jgi:hypothetical protein